MVSRRSVDDSQMDRCACGMLIAGPREYHPHAACTLFKQLKSSEHVFHSLSAVVEYGMRAQRAGVDLDQAMHDFGTVSDAEARQSAAG